jgi:hypothetical protein
MKVSLLSLHIKSKSRLQIKLLHHCAYRHIVHTAVFGNVYITYPTM